MQTVSPVPSYLEQFTYRNSPKMSNISQNGGKRRIAFIAAFRNCPVSSCTRPRDSRQVKNVLPIYPFIYIVLEKENAAVSMLVQLCSSVKGSPRLRYHEIFVDLMGMGTRHPVAGNSD